MAAIFIVKTTQWQKLKSFLLVSFGFRYGCGWHLLLSPSFGASTLSLSRSLRDDILPWFPVDAQCKHSEQREEYVFFFCCRSIFFVLFIFMCEFRLCSVATFKRDKGSNGSPGDDARDKLQWFCRLTYFSINNFLLWFSFECVRIVAPKRTVESRGITIAVEILQSKQQKWIPCED